MLNISGPIGYPCGVKTDCHMKRWNIVHVDLVGLSSTNGAKVLVHLLTLLLHVPRAVQKLEEMPSKTNRARCNECWILKNQCCITLAVSWKVWKHIENHHLSSALLTGTVKAKEVGTVHMENAFSTCVCLESHPSNWCPAWPLALCVQPLRSTGLWTETMQRIKACHGHFSSCQKFICSHAWRSTLPVTMHFHKMNEAQLPLLDWLETCGSMWTSKI